MNATGWISQHINAPRINVLIGRQLLVEERGLEPPQDDCIRIVSLSKFEYSSMSASGWNRTNIVK